MAKVSVGKTPKKRGTVAEETPESPVSGFRPVSTGLSEERRASSLEGSAGESVRRSTYAHERSDSADAFLPDPEGGKAFSSDDFAESRAEDFLRAATSGEDVDDETADQIVPEELGGPFVETEASEEFAMDEDASNPQDATPEPLPRAIHGLADRPRQ